MEAIFNLLLLLFTLLLIPINLDHVHLILDLHPDNNISQLIGSLKSASSRMIRKEFAEEYYHWYPKGKVFWGRQKFAVSVEGAPLDVLKDYIDNQ